MKPDLPGGTESDRVGGNERNGEIINLTTWAGKPIVPSHLKELTDETIIVQRRMTMMPVGIGETDT
jgi:hypothetical protein